MMAAFNKLPGFVTTPPGLERVILRRLPVALVLGTLLPPLPSLVARVFQWMGYEAGIAAWITTLEIYAVSVVILHWTVVFTVAIAAFTVMVMKGPAYVADAYLLEDADTPAARSRSSRPVGG